MSVESVESNETLDVYLQSQEKLSVNWNGRTVSIDYTKHHPDIKTCGVYIESIYGNPEPPSPFWDYFNTEAKKQNKFDIALYQHHIRCNNEESKKALESAFEKMGYGVVGVVIGVIWFMPSRGMSCIQIYECGKQIWQGVEDFKKAMQTAGTPLDGVKFVTWADDYRRNTDELMKHSILEPWKPLDNSGFELMDKQYQRKTLDPSFNPWNCA